MDPQLGDAEGRLRREEDAARRMTAEARGSRWIRSSRRREGRRHVRGTGARSSRHQEERVAEDFS